MAKEKKKSTVSAGSSLGISAAKLQQMKVERKFSYVFNRLLIFMFIASLSLVFTVIYCIIQYRTMYNLYYTTAEVVADARGGMQSLAKNVCYIIAAESEETVTARMDAALSDSAQLKTAIEELHEMYPNSEYVKKTEATYNEVVEGAQTWIAMVNEGADKHDLYVEFEAEIVPGLTQLKDDILELEEVSHGNA
ncbi:MAG: hypothetical protein IJQ21_06540, partial [Lachnospiraceae bacterium]|nr:hypothetical protein [Lachnospiraceae bacterium]